MAKKKTTVNNLEPEINPLEYNNTLSKALNYYNDTMSLSDYKNAVIDYALTIGKTIPRSIPEYEFRGIGAVCRLLLKDQYISVHHINNVLSRIKELENYKKPTNWIDELIEEVEKQKPVKKVVDNTRPFIDWFIDRLDEFVLGNHKSLSNASTEYSSHSFNKSDSKKVLDYANKVLANYSKILKDFDTDEQTRESYQDFGKSGIKKLVSALTEFIAFLNKFEVKAKATKPAKDKPALVQVKNIPYLKTYNNDLHGIHPKDVIGKSFVMIFDTATRDLIILQSIAGKFKASGMSFINLDEAKCFKKKLRKPEVQIQELLSLLEQNKKSYLDYFDTIKTTQQKSAGRMSPEKIIIKAF